jgi:Tol biopolymer transport system component/DNA-binding winged helix-turn-helix (wHTH) protein
MQSAPVVRFGAFELDLQAGELRKHGLKIKLQDQPFQILVMLLEQPGRVVTREQLHQKLWAEGTFVDFEHGLNAAVQRLRQAIGDTAENPGFVETLARRGYRFVAPVDSGKATEIAPVATTGRKSRLPWALAGTALLLAAAGFGLWFLRPVHHAVPKMAPFTSYPGQQITPAVSPDGKQVAFAWDGEKGGNFDIYVKLVDAGTPLRLTSNPADEYSPAWSPDGSHIAFCRDKSTGKTATASSSSLAQQIFGVFVSDVDIWMIPALGGVERKLGESAGCGLLSWSPDGKQLALADKSAPGEPYSIFLLSVETGDKRKLTSPPHGDFGDRSPRFSPDGKTIAFDRSSSLLSDEIYLLDVTSEERPLAEPRRLILDEQPIFGLDWTADGRRIVFSSHRLGSTNLWVTPASGGTPEPLSVAGENAVLPSVARVGNRLVYERLVRDLNIWRVPGPNSSNRKSAPSRFIASTKLDADPEFSPDGTKIVFGSSRSGSYEIWVSDSDGHNPVQLTFSNGPAPGSARWSPDSRWLAFDSPKAGNYDIYVISADGGSARRLTSGPCHDVRPSWSRDGRWIYFGSNRSGDWQIWKQPAAGGTAVQVTKGGGNEAFESADGKFVYWAKGGITGIWRVSVEGGEESLALDAVTQNLWALTGQGICYFDLKNPAVPILKFYSLATRKTALLRQFPRGTEIDTLSKTLSVSPDGRWILHTQFDQAGSDLMLVENFH